MLMEDVEECREPVSGPQESECKSFSVYNLGFCRFFFYYYYLPYLLWETGQNISK